jgi:hypothetical protein
MKVRSFFRNIGKAIVTKEIFENKIFLRLLYKYFLVGMLIRLIFLPFFFQRDLLSTYQRAAQTVFGGNLGSDFQQFIINFIHSIYLFIIKSILPIVGEYSEILLQTDTWSSWVNFISSENVFIVISLFKVLYLIFDILCMFLVMRLLFDDEPEKRLKVFKLWVLNPFVIFILYIFARHDIIGIFLTLVALLLAKYKRKYWAIFVLALAVAVRFFPIMILPILIFYLADKKKDYIILFSAGISGLIAVEIFSYFYFGRSVIFSLLNTQLFDYILWPKLELVTGSHGSIFIFISVYIIIILSFLHIKKKSFDTLLNYGAIIYLAYISLCFFHPQYVLWTVPFLVIIFARRKSLVYYHWFQFVLLLILLLYWSPHANTWIFAPIDHRFFIYLPKINTIIQLFYNDAKFVNIFRSIFTGVSLWMIYLIYKENKNVLSGNSIVDN